jgi:hypothetical protein
MLARLLQSSKCLKRAAVFFGVIGRREKKSEAGIKGSLNILKISEILPDFSPVKADQISISFLLV